MGVPKWGRKQTSAATKAAAATTILPTDAPAAGGTTATQQLSAKHLVRGPTTGLAIPAPHDKARGDNTRGEHWKGRKYLELTRDKNKKRKDTAQQTGKPKKRRHEQQENGGKEPKAPHSYSGV